MAMNKFMKTECSLHIPHTQGTDEQWTHWKLVLIRSRYSTVQEVGVQILFHQAKPSGGRWVSCEEPLLKHHVLLGSLDDDDFCERLKTDESQSSQLTDNQGVKRELGEALDAIRAEAKSRVANGNPLSIESIVKHVVDACVYKPDAAVSV